MPVNPAEPHYRSFITEFLPHALKMDMGIIAMKVYFRGLAIQIPGVDTVEPFYRFALSHPVTTAVIGCDTIAQLDENVKYARSFVPLTEKEMVGIIDFVAPYVRELLYYKP
jgi:predicted aldo/keto reductase-like oxidoreductase